MKPQSESKASTGTATVSISQSFVIDQSIVALAPALACISYVLHDLSAILPAALSAETSEDDT
jgi:hypothetical protein